MPKPEDSTATASATNAATPATIDATTDDNSDATRATDAATQWLSVARASEIEGVSPRAIQRRCQKNKYRNRRVQTPQGERIEIDAASLANRATMPCDARDDEGRDDSDRQRDAPVDADIKSRTIIPFGFSENSQSADRSELNHEVELLRVQLDSARAEATREREFSSTLKAQLEDANRNAAELRASLREAQRAQPKQLAQGTPDAATPDAPPERAPIGQANNVPTEAPDAVKSPATREARPLWKVMFGIR